MGRYALGRFLAIPVTQVQLLAPAKSRVGVLLSTRNQNIHIAIGVPTITVNTSHINLIPGGVSMYYFDIEDFGDMITAEWIAIGSIADICGIIEIYKHG